jgi:hypothetical protein
VHTAYRFQLSVCIRLYKKLGRKQAEVVQNDENENVHGVGHSEAADFSGKLLSNLPDSNLSFVEVVFRYIEMGTR